MKHYMSSVTQEDGKEGTSWSAIYLFLFLSISFFLLICDYEFDMESSNLRFWYAAACILGMVVVVYR